ncbi:adenosylcobinamide-phosphate synthase CbiB [Mangrovibacterium marinum]|uniref:Cobalamin biosynthesis protein CobD n=1 Tax=Mangrovibacterium marinum TaxID=1639118 RepID=A0A2T5BXB5_9BACT|nr:adenosylcobinamide-phosphate synthase CbiB [Mangrovibacterium marinum]PTN04807.1 adenosylcobinamide-phosphate synthase [Mangrovibacterium marinum]
MELLILPLLIGFAVDCLLGDPRWLPHPIRLFGWLIAWFEKRFNQGNHRKLKGALTSVLLVGGTWLLLFLLFGWLKSFPTIYLMIASAGVFFGLANRSLIYESWLVIRALQRDGLEAGRKQLSYIVGRDTTKLNEQQIRTAVLETMAENLSDGVIAPLFFYALGGVPGLFAFKMASTLDSMIAYKSERFKSYGCFAARLDDLLNLIPARLTALLMVLVSLSWSGLTHIFRYGHQHASPNAGYPESALAGILKCRFGGPNVYHGKMVEKPYIGHHQKQITTRDFWMAAYVNTATAVVMVGGIVAVYLTCI